MAELPSFVVFKFRHPVLKARLKIVMNSSGLAICVSTFETHCEGERRCLTGCGQSGILNGETLIEEKPLNGTHISVWWKVRLQSILIYLKCSCFHVFKFILQIV